MSTVIEIHALQQVPPSNINRDDSGAPKSALYGGVQRARVSSQAWKRAMREAFNERVEPEMTGTRSRMLVKAIARQITAKDPELADRAITLAADAIEAAGLNRPVGKKRKGEEATEDDIPETGYLVFMSAHQIRALAEAAVAAADSADPVRAMKAEKVKELADSRHSIDIALFGRMVADSTDLNVDAACQVAHALSVHEATPEYDFYTAVDDAKKNDAESVDAGAGMMGTVGFVSSTLYRYAAVNVDQLRENLGDADATRLAIGEFLRAFVESMPTGKISTFANTTRPSVVLVTVGSGQPASLVGAFEKPVRAGAGYMEPAIAALATHAAETFETWRRPEHVYVTGLPSSVEGLGELGERVAFEDLLARSVDAALEEK